MKPKERLDLATASRVVAAVDPTLRVEQAVRLRGGAISDVFEVTTTNGLALVVKIYTDEWHWKMAKEAFVYDRLRNAGVDVAVPTILAVDDSKAVLSDNYVVMTKLEGQVLATLLDGLSDAELIAINRQVGAVLRALHEVRFDEFGYLTGDGVFEGHATNIDYMRFQFDKKLREFGELGADPDLRRAIERHVAARAHLFEGCPHASLCHNDCHEWNVFVLPTADGWSFSGLIDFENAVAGDPVLDLAKTHYYAYRPSDETLAALADGHGDLRGDWRDALHLYVLYHALELWDWFASLDDQTALAEIAEDMRRLCSER